MSKEFTKEFELDNYDSRHSGNPEEIGELPQGNGSSIGAYFNLINALAGSGTLGLPAAIKQGGWIGIFLIIISALFCIYTGNLLVKCMNAKTKHPIETYPDVGYASFGIFGRTVVQFCQYSIICGGVTLYLVLAGGNFYSIAKGANNGTELEKKWWICIAGVIVWIPFALLKTIQEVAFISAFGTISTIITVVVSVVLGLLDLPEIKNFEYENVNWTGIPIALATICFSYGGTVVYPHVYRSMRKPQHWNYILVAATFTALVLYVLIGSVGYYVYSADTKSPIFDNLQGGAPKTVAVLFISCHVLCASPVFLCSFSLEIERWLNINVAKLGKRKEFFFRVLLRTFIVACLVAIGNLVPYFGNLMSLVGAISECMLIFLVPTLCHLKMFGIRGRPFYEYLWIALIIIIAVICVIFGSIDAVIGLIADYKKDHGL